MRKKLFILFFILSGTSLFAQYIFSDLNNLPGVYVVYETDDNEIITLLNMVDYHFARLYDKNTGKQVGCRLNISRDYRVDVELIDVKPGDDEEYAELLVNYVRRIFSYSPEQIYRQLPSGIRSEMRDLEGNVLRYGYVDFYIPITNLIKETDVHGNVLMECVRFGIVGAEQIDSLLRFYNLLNYQQKEMERIPDSIGLKHLSNGTFSFDVPVDWEMKENGSVWFQNLTSRDALLFTKSISLAEQGLADIYSLINMELLSLAALILPDTVELIKINDVPSLRFDVVDLQSMEITTVVMCFFSADGDHIDIIQINSYKDFYLKNEELIMNILGSARPE